MTGEGVQEQAWQADIDAYLRLVQSDATSREFLIDGANNIIRKLLEQGLMPDLGTLEEYLATQHACLRLVAANMQGEYAPSPDIISVDPRDGSEKTHGMMVVVSPELELVEHLFAQVVPDPVQNIELLRHHTGLVRPAGQEVDSDLPQTLEAIIDDLEARLNVLRVRGASPDQILSLTVQTVSDLGIIQEYLRYRPESIFELTFRPADQIGVEGARAVDLITGEERPYYYVASFGEARFPIVDRETNVHRLRHETGVAVI